MPIPAAPAPRRAKPAGESFVLKSVLVASALFVAALVMVNQEFYLSTPSHGLSETEAVALKAVR
jgi:hypothetical protein